MMNIGRYRRLDGRVPVSEWLVALKDPRGRARIEIRLQRLALGLFGDVKSVGQGVHELRVNSGPGYRVYFGRHGLELIVLLCGGDKSTQSQDIETAHGYWRDWKRRQP